MQLKEEKREQDIKVTKHSRKHNRNTINLKIVIGQAVRSNCGLECQLAPEVQTGNTPALACELKLKDNTCVAYSVGTPRVWHREGTVTLVRRTVELFLISLFPPCSLLQFAIDDDAGPGQSERADSSASQ